MGGEAQFRRIASAHGMPHLPSMDPWIPVSPWCTAKSESGDFHGTTPPDGNIAHTPGGRFFSLDTRVTTVPSEYDHGDEHILPAHA